MVFARIIHVIGNILWLGGGTIAAFTMVFLASESKETRAAAAKAVRKIVLYAVTPGMLLGWAGALYMLLTYWTEMYSKQPWVHMKLTIALVATAFSGVLTGRLRKAAAGTEEISMGAMKLSGAVLLLSAIVSVVLVMTKP